MGDGLKRARAATKASRQKKTATEKRQERGWPEPGPRQVWRDNDTRTSQPREVVIRELKQVRKRGKDDRLVLRTMAICQGYEGGVRVGRVSSVDTDRMVPGSSGYSYVGEAQVEAEEIEKGSTT